MPVAWMWPMGYGQTQTSSHAGGIRSSEIRRRTSASLIRRPSSSRYSNPLPRRRRIRPGPLQSERFKRPTAAAAADLRTRMETLIDTPYDELSVYGPEELCERLLRDEALEAGLDPLFAPVSAADRLALLLDRIDDLPLRRHEIRGNPAPLLAGFVERIDQLKDEMIRSVDFRRWAEGLAAGPESDDERTLAAHELEFAQIYAAHDRLLAQAGALDHGDVILQAFRLLHEKPHVRARV